MHNLLVQQSDGTIIWAEHFPSLMNAINQAADHLAHPEEDAAVYADGLWETWKEGGRAQVSSTHRGITVTLWDEQAIQAANRY